MIEAADADAYEATLIKQAMEPLNLALPGILTEAAERVEPGMKGIFGSEWERIQNHTRTVCSVQSTRSSTIIQFPGTHCCSGETVSTFLMMPLT